MQRGARTQRCVFALRWISRVSVQAACEPRCSHHVQGDRDLAVLCSTAFNEGAIAVCMYCLLNACRRQAEHAVWSLAAGIALTPARCWRS